jgi:hypothetical protein
MYAFKMEIYIYIQCFFFFVKKIEKYQNSHPVNLLLNKIVYSALNSFFLLTRASLGHNSVSIKTSFTNLSDSRPALG